jgi:hypothetical protein
MTELAASVSSDESDVPNTPESPTVIVPDRADAPVSEVTERFLRAVIAKVPLERIEELHLFAPLRQGGVETGIAVVAARVPMSTPVEVVADVPPVDALALDDAAPDDAEHDEAALNEAVPDDGALHVDSLDDVGLDDDALPVHEPSDGESPYLDDVVVVAQGVVPDVVAEANPEVAPEVPPATPLIRHTVYTARYRLVLKGPERGKWEADVVDEADAPLITVEMVVRGVQRRAGEETEILRYSDRQIAKALRMAWPLPVREADAVPAASDVVAPATVG